MNCRKFIPLMVWSFLGVTIYFVCITPAFASDGFFRQETGEIPDVTLMSVFDNYQVVAGLKTAWGFGTVVKTPKEILLFDTGGDAETLLFNMKKMNIDPISIDKVVISHIHADHLGGLKGFLEKNSDVQFLFRLLFLIPSEKR